VGWGDMLSLLLPFIPGRYGLVTTARDRYGWGKTFLVDAIESDPSCHHSLLRAFLAHCISSMHPQLAESTSLCRMSCQNSFYKMLSDMSFESIYRNKILLSA
jgi:hypothetical protein